MMTLDPQANSENPSSMIPPPKGNFLGSGVQVAESKHSCVLGFGVCSGEGERGKQDGGGKELSKGVVSAGGKPQPDSKGSSEAQIAQQTQCHMEARGRFSVPPCQSLGAGV